MTQARSSLAITSHDVARYILDHCAPMTGMKLQKLVYYSQAWNLVWNDEPLFDEPIEAWAKGPVVRDLYNVHQSDSVIDEWPYGNPESLTEDQKRTIDNVIKLYAPMTAGVLSSLTHDETPWIKARQGIPPRSKGHGIISLESMKEFYSSL